MKSNQSEFDKLKNKIVNLDWNEDNLYKHTIKHPIGDWKKENNFNNNQLYRFLSFRIFSYIILNFIVY